MVRLFTLYILMLEQHSDNVSLKKETRKTEREEESELEVEVKERGWVCSVDRLMYMCDCVKNVLSV